jgi:DNA repair exonuclease SbcCD ATPase subunit
MKILQLQADNFKRIKAIDISPQDNVIVLSGKNGEGKTSALDAIWFALSYRAASKNNPQPLRAGETKGHAGPIDLGDYIVTRTFTENGTTLKVTTPDGSVINSPQKLLDGLIGDLTFDPWEFARMKESEQREYLGDLLYNLTGGKVNLAEFDRQIEALYTDRTDLNREKKRLTTLLTTFKPPTDAEPDTEVSVDNVSSKLEQAINTNERRARLIESNERAHAKVLENEKRIAALQQEIDSARMALRAQNDELDKTPMADVDKLRYELSTISARNSRAREIQEYRRTLTGLRKIETEIVEKNDKMELITINKAEALEQSSLPIQGLRVTETGIMITNEDGNLVPFSQASAAQRLRISLGIAMASNPTLRVIRISDGSLLDDNSMKIIKDMASNEDFQIWIEYMSRNDDDKIGVYIEDGQVAN